MLNQTPPFTGLIAATHTPFTDQGELNLAIVERQAQHLLRNNVLGVFIGGSTGESHSLTLEERLSLAKRWSEVVRGTSLQLLVHVGSNCLSDARTMAAQAESLGAKAVSALAPSYFKPANVDALVACCAEIASAAPQTPFYYYDIPALTGVNLSVPDFLRVAADRVPTLRGIKFTHTDLASYQRCLHSHERRFDILWGVDEFLLAALALGGQGAVGSTYNFAAPVYGRLLAAFAKGDLAAARVEQFRSVQLVNVLVGYGFMAAAKALMGILGVNVGPARLPSMRLSPEQVARLRADLEKLGFFNWIA